MRKSLLSLILALAIMLPVVAAAQTCPSSITSIGGETSCWVPPSSGTTISDLVDSNPLTIANDSTYALQPNNTLGCGTGSSATPSGISSGCDIQSNATYQPTSMTLVMKFAGTGGPLAQFGSVSSVNALYQYFELYLDSFGRLTFGAYNYGALNVIQTGKPDRPLVFADGNPHIVVASIGSNGMRLYVDGSLLASNSQTLANYTSGYWLFGTAALTGAGPSGNSWPYGPAQNWFNGTIYYMAWWNSQLTDAQAETLSNPGSNPPSPISNSYVNVTGQLASLAISQGLAYANLPVTFQVGAGQLPACGLTTPVAASTQTYQTDAAGNLPSNVQLPQGVHVNMLWAGTTTPLIMPCQTSINISELIPAQTPLPDAVSAINLAGPQFQGVTVANPATGTIAPATLTSPGTVPNTCAGGTTTINRNLGAQQTCTMSASTSITFSNLEDGAPPLIVDVIENATGGYTPTFVAPSGYTLIWPGNTNVQPSQPSTAAGVHTFYGFVIEGTNIYGSITSSTSSSGTFPLTATANFNNYSGININTLNLSSYTAPTPTITSTCSGTCATTYTYEITCLGDNSTHTAPSTSETCTNAASLSGSNFCTLNWTAGTGCTSGYNVYGRVSGSLGLLKTVSGTSYSDTGTDSPGAAPPSTNTTGSVNTGGNESITGNASVGGTLGVTGNAALSSATITTPLGIASGGTNAGTASGGFNNLSPLTTLGDTLYENSTPASVRLGGNTSTTKEFLTQTGTGTVSAAPAWGTIVTGDIPATIAPTTVEWNNNTDLTETNAPREAASGFLPGNPDTVSVNFGGIKLTVNWHMRGLICRAVTGPTGCTQAPVFEWASEADTACTINNGSSFCIVSNANDAIPAATSIESFVVVTPESGCTVKAADITCTGIYTVD